MKTQKPITSRTNLIVPYNERHLAKSKGAKWDVARKVWYIEDSFDDPKDIFDFVQWAPERLKQATKSKPLEHPPFIVTQPRTPRKKNWGKK